MKPRSNTTKRFLNFPLMMLADTITEPFDGLHTIAAFAIAEYGNRFEVTPDDALVQAMYVHSQRPDEFLPLEVACILSRDDIADSAVQASRIEPGTRSVFIAVRGIVSSLSEDAVAIEIPLLDERAGELVRIRDRGGETNTAAFLTQKGPPASATGGSFDGTSRK